MGHRFSGHESFSFRYAWLPKAVSILQEDRTILVDDERTMMKLGLGKNMVRSLRFWVQVTGIAAWGKEDGFTLTPFGKALLGSQGADPFLEDSRTLWLLHWVIATQQPDPLFAWDYLLNHWHQPEITRSAVLETFKRETLALNRALSPVTLEQHFDVFLHTYVPTRGPKATIQEDTLDCPLVELNFLQPMSERRLDSAGRSETIYTFRRDYKPDISPELFLFCLAQFWQRHRSTEETLSFYDIAMAPGSVGQVFKLAEWDIRERLESLADDSHGKYTYQESHAIQRVTRQGRPDVSLEMIYAA